MDETGKSVQRRLHDAAFLTRYFRGEGIDIGAGPDPLGMYMGLFPLLRDVRRWDVNDGDAQAMDGVPDLRYDLVHSSHCLEHLADPAEAVRNWFRIVRPNGHLVVLVPDEDMYEQGEWPSTFNADHLWTFATYKARSWSPRSVNVFDLLRPLGPAADIVKVERLVASFREGMYRFDQTRTPVGECAIEFVVRRCP